METQDDKAGPAPDYEIVQEDDEKNSMDATQDEIKSPPCMQWITHVAMPCDFEKDHSHGRWIVGLHPPIPAHMEMCLLAYAGQSLYQMIANGLPPALVVNEPFLATMMGSPQDLLTTPGDLFAKYMAIMSFYSANASSPTETEALHYESTETFHEELTSIHGELKSFLVHRYLKDTAFTGDDHLKLETPADISSDQMNQILQNRDSMSKRPDDGATAVVIARFLLNRLMLHIRSGGRDLVCWFTSRRLKKAAQVVVEIDEADMLPHQTPVKSETMPFVQGQKHVKARFRKTPRWFQEFCRRRSWFFPSVLPAWFSDMWLMRVTVRIVMYEQVKFMRVFLDRRRASGREVLSIAASDPQATDTLCGRLANEVRKAYEDTLLLAGRMNVFVAELLSPARCDGDVIGKPMFHFIPNAIEEKDTVTECVVGPSEIVEIDGCKAYADDGKLHIGQDVYDRFKAESAFISTASASMIQRLCSMLGYAEGEVEAVTGRLEALVPDDENNFFKYGTPARDIAKLLLCVGLQDAVERRVIELMSQDGSHGHTVVDSKNAFQMMHAMQMSMIKEVISDSNRLMIGMYAKSHPQMMDHLKPQIEPAKAPDNE
ncbi:MAG: hypothetical protein AB7P49_00645 [Bdellovibrionales bacterium]